MPIWHSCLSSPEEGVHLRRAGLPFLATVAAHQSMAFAVLFLLPSSSLQSHTGGTSQLRLNSNGK